MWAKKLRVLASKMVGSSQTLIALRVVRSKLRKREETNNNSLGHGPTRTHPAPQLAAPDSAKVSYAQSHPGNGVVALEAAAVTAVAAVNAAAPAVAVTTTTAAAVAVAVTAAAETSDSASSGVDGVDEDEAFGKVAPLELFLWSYPAQQLSPYSGTKDSLVRELPCEVPQDDSKGLRKNLRGKWKRLVKRKPDEPCTIPAELRDQLKQIYVY